jgi:hypothetical protein
MTLKGAVMDTTSNIQFYDLLVINRTSQEGQYGKASGEFSIQCNPGDQIAFSVKGYHHKAITVPKQSKCVLDTTIFIQSKIQEYKEVMVYPIKSLDKIKKERESLAKKETRTVTGVSVLQSPITALYERFSKKARSKRKIAKMEHQDEINAIVKDLLRLYVSYDVVYLDEEEFMDFVRYLDINENYLKTATDYELVTYIQARLDEYKRMNPEIFKK